MMGGWGTPTNASPISMDQAVAAAQQYVAGYNNKDLALAEIMEFANNFYVARDGEEHRQRRLRAAGRPLSPAPSPPSSAPT